MIDISPDEKRRAIKISQELQHFFDTNPGTHTLRSPDAYLILVTKGLVERDRHNGIKFREFLNKLKKANALDFIPQCRPEPGNGNMTNWIFQSAAHKTVKAVHISTVPAIPEIDPEKIAELKEVVKGYPKRNPKDFGFQEIEKRKTYPRAYEIWFEPENQLLIQASKLTTDSFLLAEIFGRQPSVIEKKLEELL